MNSALSPREIQARIRAGASPAEVAAEAGLQESDIEGFAGPVLGEREFVAKSALAATIRRRGENAHRNLGELVTDRLRQRGIDASKIVWDAWRQEDLRWRVVGVLRDEAGERRAEFIFDRKARISSADNADARWMIGEELPNARRDEENTVDLDDEMALLRAIKAERRTLPAHPGQDVPDPNVMHDDFEHTSQLDSLYDMLSGISEDSVRIYTGLPPLASVARQADPKSEAEEDTVVLPKKPRKPVPEPIMPEFSDEDFLPEYDLTDELPEESPQATKTEQSSAESQLTEPDRPDQQTEAEKTVQDSLLEDNPKTGGSSANPAKPAKRPKRKGRASVPSWDEIMFGGR